MKHLNITTAMKAICTLTRLGLVLWASVELDLRYTQYNAIPTSVNPAFAGSLDDARLATVYRNQWAASARLLSDGTLQPTGTTAT